MTQRCSIPVGETADSTHPLLCWDIYVLPLAHLNIKLQQLYRKKKKNPQKQWNKIRSHTSCGLISQWKVYRGACYQSADSMSSFWILMHVFRASPLRSATSAAEQSFDAPVVKAVESHDPLWLCETCYVFAIKHLLATLVWRMKVCGGGCYWPVVSVPPPNSSFT